MVPRGVGLSAETARQQFLESLTHERRASPHTVENYGRDLSRFVAFLAARSKREDPTMELVDVYFLRSFLGERSKELAPASLARSIAALRAWMRWLVRRGALAKNPAEELATPKVRRSLPTVVSVDAAKEIVESPDDEKSLGARDRAILELLYGAGIRVGELVRLDLVDADLDRGQARVLGKGGKERIVPIGGAAARALEHYLSERGKLVAPRTRLQDPRAFFLNARGTRLSIRGVQTIVQRAGALGAGRSDLHPHALRHTCATHMMGGGADLRAIQEMLGHASLTTTQRYTHVSIEHLMKVYDNAHPLARREPTAASSGGKKRTR